MATFLLVILVAALVMVVAGVWIALRLLGLVLDSVGWIFSTLLGDKRPSQRESRAVDRCTNAMCGARWRKDARFCARCGRARYAMLPAPRDLLLAHEPARPMSRVA